MDEKGLKSTEYDGIYFLPGEDDNELVISYFNFRYEMAGGKPIESTSVGYKYHIAFFNRDENGSPKFEDAFEAILADPSVWIGNLAGAGVYGCVVKKTDKSSDWFDNYLRKTVGYDKIKQMIQALKLIAETK